MSPRSISPNNLSTQIRMSSLESLVEEKCSQYLALQQAGCFTDIILYCKGGYVSLHQAVLFPLSRLWLYDTPMVSVTDIPMVLILPNYDLSTPQSLVSLLYTGSCNHTSSANYLSLLSIFSSLGINLFLCRYLRVPSTSHTNSIDVSHAPRSASFFYTY